MSTNLHLLDLKDIKRRGRLEGAAERAAMFGDHEKWLGVAVAERLDQFVPRGTHEQGRARLQGATARSKGSGGSLFEPRTDTQVGTPATNITLFQDGDEHDYNLGQRVGGNVLAQTMGYINGTISG